MFKLLGLGAIAFGIYRLLTRGKGWGFIVIGIAMFVCC